MVKMDFIRISNFLCIMRNGHQFSYFRTLRWQGILLVHSSKYSYHKKTHIYFSFEIYFTKNMSKNRTTRTLLLVVAVLAALGALTARVEIMDNAYSFRKRYLPTCKIIKAVMTHLQARDTISHRHYPEPQPIS